MDLERPNRSGCLDFFSAYKTLRNRWRPYRRKSIIFRCLEVLKKPHVDQVSALHEYPWQVLLLLKWVCQDQQMHPNLGIEIPTEEFFQLREQLFQLPSITDMGSRDNLPLKLWLRQLLRPQIGFQRSLSQSFIRDAALILSLDSSGKLEAEFSRKTGIQLETFIDLLIACYAAIVAGQMQFAIGWFAPLSAKYGSEQILRFLELVSATEESLVRYFRALPDARRKVASEYFEFPAVVRFPLYREANVLHAWNLQVFYRAMENMVHAVLSESGHAYTEKFGKVFETHVLAESELCGGQLIPEKELANLVPVGT